MERRWISFQYEGRCQAVVAMRAVSLIREQNHLTFDYNGLSEQMLTITAEWAEQLSIHGELGMRDIILRSFSPSIYGLYPIKLATLLAICSCNETGDYKAGDGIHQRGQSHLLMIGDPGMAKSKLLLSATEVAPRAVHTTGMGCSSAGLTAAAVKVCTFLFNQRGLSPKSKVILVVSSINPGLGLEIILMTMEILFSGRW